MIILVSVPNIPPGKISIVQMNPEICLVLLSIQLSKPMSLGTLNRATIDSAVVVLVASCAASRNAGTIIGRGT